MIKNIWQVLADLEENNRAGALCTVIDSQGSTPRHEGSRMVVFPDGTFVGTVGGGEIEGRIIHEALQSLEDGQSRKLSFSMIDPKRGDPGVCGGTMEIYVEPILPKSTLVVIGGGHVGKAVAHLAQWLDFRVVVCDDRPEFASTDANPDADVLVNAPMGDLADQIEIDRSTYLVLTTRGSGVDVAGLPDLLRKCNPGYLGIIGSKRRWVTTRKGLLEAGISEEILSKIHSPIGLELQAETPEEIAVSILAEILMCRRKASGKSMKE
ncbi:xanthine and CO dehydrogenases maturation factor, XdhC/CoxF family [Longilinea arvoryzae]|uniref:Xanthine and CO dehydrogenases maturation factor, XdhC/CoxF family n=1 Tax=Longilinea arvoryzae TaxID=360412 RepID=A0A0S7BGI0_9CHLR|nr:XdhC/CoxI family protein [Longilinea arvoryzae]GAP14701.1 xanthine and CO dehydrogenases maturation factor, XdhC/CoxF family [Longilinea arvoryzae]